MVIRGKTKNNLIKKNSSTSIGDNLVSYFISLLSEIKREEKR
jgi:hypothetical protein